MVLSRNNWRQSRGWGAEGHSCRGNRRRGSRSPNSLDCCDAHSTSEMGQMLRTSAVQPLPAMSAGPQQADLPGWNRTWLFECQDRTLSTAEKRDALTLIQINSGTCDCATPRWSDAVHAPTSRLRPGPVADSSNPTTVRDFPDVEDWA